MPRKLNGRTAHRNLRRIEAIGPDGANLGHLDQRTSFDHLSYRRLGIVATGIDQTSKRPFLVGIRVLLLTISSL